MTEDQSPLIPEQHSGIQTNTESSLELPSEEAARSLFAELKNRLLDVHVWHQMAGKATADFKLTDHQGNEVYRSVQQGDHFKIDIPGPGSVSGEGYDWVQVEAIDDQEDCVSVRVRPATNPLNNREDVAHFFSDEATSSFVVRRDGAKLTAGVYGRNEKPNTHAETLVDKARNTAVASGAISGFSKLQWKSLVNGLLKDLEA